MPSLAEIFLRWVNTVLMLINRRSAISLLVNPFANRQSTSISRCDSSLPSERLWRDVSIMSPSCFRNAASSQWRLSVKPILSSVELDSRASRLRFGMKNPGREAKASASAINRSAAMSGSVATADGLVHEASTSNILARVCFRPIATAVSSVMILTFRFVIASRR